MKHLREKLPRLNRRQRIARNLVLAALMLFFAWAVTGFAPPTDALCTRWTAEQFGLSEPEILLRQKEENNSSRHYLILRWSDGRVAALETYRKFGFLRRGGRLLLGEETDGAALLLGECSPGPKALYVWADAPGAVRAECRMRLRGQVGASYSDEDTGVREDGVFDWDETYIFQAEPNENGVYRFAVRSKYDDTQRLRQAAERGTLRELGYNLKGETSDGFSAEFTVDFYNGVGNLVKTWRYSLT